MENLKIKIMKIKRVSILLSDTCKFLITMFLIISICSCNNLDKSDQKINKIDEVKYSAHLNWMGHYYLDEKSRHRLIKEVEREFRVRNQEIDLKLDFAQELYKGWDEQNVAIVSMMETGNYKYDIVDMDPSRYSNIGTKLRDPDWAHKYLVDFSEFDWFKESHKSIIYSNKQIRESTGNLMPAPYLEGIYISLWVNTKVLSQIGGTLKQFGINMNDIHDLLNKIKAYNKKNGSKIELFDLERGYSSFHDLARMLFISAYFGLTDEEGNRDVGLKAIKRVAEEMEYLQQQTQMKVPSTNWNFSTNVIFKDKALMCILPSWAIGKWQSVDSLEILKMVPCELPIFEHDSKYYPGFFQGVFGVMKKSRSE